jgi:hypothetical protein
MAKRKLSRLCVYCAKKVSTPCETKKNSETCSNKKNSSNKKPLNNG